MSVKIDGVNDSTNSRVLNENNKSVFKRCGVDSFIMSVKRYFRKILIHLERKKQLFKKL